MKQYEQLQVGDMVKILTDRYDGKTNHKGKIYTIREVNVHAIQLKEAHENKGVWFRLIRDYYNEHWTYYRKEVYL